ncbi:hypothetical protein NECAME_15108 [Necator americanus]|uniref:Uncharacterized protein n=1 Tax=Necator americanus TaxID=51031 RepID=W2SLN5_NECAM|nr:hypothetical protein NECAME_15108 [Necator americanus]ETN69751.1 hypothetical protein NECAME_15108 [Necator americanus]
MLQDGEKWSRETRVRAFSMGNSSSIQPEPALWEKYWPWEKKLQRNSCNQRDVQALIEEKILKRFLHTMQKREDGYYARLSWKEIPTALPDNRAIELRRLDTVWNSFNKNKELLNKYNDTFKEQEHSMSSNW